MTDQIRDAAMIDTVFAYCALNNVEPISLENLTFKEVVRKLAGVCQYYPAWVWASHEVRQYYPVCHSECHIARVRAFVESGCQWGPESGPNEPKYTNNVLEFPSSTTKH